MSDSIAASSRSRSTVVEQILEQGQRLRNAMVKSILDNDPFYIDAVDTNNLKNAHMKRSNQKLPEKDFSSSQKHKAVVEFEWDESSPIDSPPAMSAEDFYCTCKICSLYRDQATWKHKSNEANVSEGRVPSLNLARKDRAHQFSGTALGEYDSEDSQVPRDVSRILLPRNVLDVNWMGDATKPKQAQNLSDEITRSIQEDYRSRAAEYFKYVDSLKITIHSLILNQAGNRKVSVSAIDNRFKLPTSVSHSYFVEYSIPDCLVKHQPKTKSKIDSGLSANLFRICSKKLQNEEIYFKHTSVHDMADLLQLNLQDVELKFQVSCRTPKQKQTNVVGNASFKMSTFEVLKHLTSTQDFPVLNEDFAMGTLKMTLQLGCGRMYFGKEFVDFVLKNTKGPESSTTEKTENRLSATYSSPANQPTTSTVFVDGRASNQVGVNVHSNSVDLPSEKPSPSISARQQNGKAGHFNRYAKQVSISDKHTSEGIISSASTNRSDFRSNAIKENTNFPELLPKTVNTQANNLNNKSLLYGLIYVSEAQYFEGPINSYLSCQVFCQGDTLCSRVVYQSKDPVFNFYQKVPFLFDDVFLLCMRDNSIVVDFWERTGDEDVAVGTSQLSLHQFYVAYRNLVIASTLVQNRLPVTISDWWEPICNPVNGNLYGQMKVLVAVGTADQIYNLEVERGLKDNSVSVTYIPIVPEAEKHPSEPARVRSFKRPGFLNKTAKESTQSAPVADKGSKKVLNNSPQTKSDVVKTVKIDIGVQSDLDMMDPSKSAEQSDGKTQDLLEAFLAELVRQKQKNIYVESATNTEATDIYNNLNKNINNDLQSGSGADGLSKLSSYNNATNVQLRKTSDLLDYLNGALESKMFSPEVPALSILNEDENNFKAHVIVEGALHLPSRRKCKSKKTRRKNFSYEEALPSTYVTFETVPGAELKITSIVPRTTSPQWDFRCDVSLPGEILTNSQKRFILKVWRKNNGNSPHPNLQTDVILGFAALDLTVLLAGLPSVQGWFNIVDFSSKCNGQIKIQVTPLENISKFSESKQSPSPETVRSEPNFSSQQLATASLIDTQEAPSELLSRTLKRKFTELEEITQRLRLRLADVTKDDSDTSNDEFADEFERDLNTLCVEDDYNMVDLMSCEVPKMQESEWFGSGANDYLLKEVITNEEASNFGPSLYSRASKTTMSDSAYGSTQLSDRTGKASRLLVANSVSSSSSNTFLETASQTIPNRALTPGDKQLIAGKQRIDTLLEKLTLLAGADGESLFPSRYVSGCSMAHESELPAASDILKDLTDKEFGSGSGLNLDAILNPALFSQLCSVDVNSTPSLTEFSEGLDTSSSNAQFGNGSSSSILTQFSTHRQAPDGAGTSANPNTNLNSINKQNI